MRSASLHIHLAFKLVTALLAVAGSVVLLMALTRLIPGDPATVILGSRATPEAVAALNARIGLDRPLIEQVFAFFGRLFSGDLGEDVFNGRPVITLVAAALPNTAALAVSAMLCAVALGVPLALVSARWPGGRTDRLIGFLSVGFISTPSFVVSVFLLMMFSVKLRWFPVLGAGNSGDIGDQLWHLALPTAALAAGWIGYIARLLRASLLESEVARYRLLPTLLANDVDVLRSVDDAPGARETLDAQFAQLANATGAAAIFLLAPNGDTISASNANTPMSFLGQNFAFREYYREARRGGTGIDYARGTVSGRPGLFLSRGTANGGVVVVKLEFDELEAQWARGGGATMVEGQNGTVLITSDPALRFRSSDAGSEEGDLSALLGGAQIAAAVPIAVEGWKLVHAEPRAVALGGVVPIARLAGALAALAVLVGVRFSIR